MWAERSQFKSSNRLPRERPVSMIPHSCEPRLRSRADDTSREGLRDLRNNMRHGIEGDLGLEGSAGFGDVWRIRRCYRM